MRAEAGQSGADRQQVRDGLSSCLPACFILNIFSFIFAAVLLADVHGGVGPAEATRYERKNIET